MDALILNVPGCGEGAMADWFRFLRFIPVVALLGLAAALLTDRRRLPLALRGLRKMLRQDAGAPASAADSAAYGVSPRRRALAFLLILLAFLLVAWPA